jgi:hypothetical protein
MKKTYTVLEIIPLKNTCTLISTIENGKTYEALS